MANGGVTPRPFRLPFAICRLAQDDPGMLGTGAALRSILPGVVQVPLRGTSAFLLLDRKITLIDTGLPFSGARLLEAVRMARRSADEIEQIVITHYHPDHIGGLAELQQVLPARTGIHAVEAPVVMSSDG